VTPQQRDAQKALIEAERAEYEEAGNAANVATCDAELQRLEAEPVAEAPIEARGVVSSYLTTGSPPTPPPPKTNQQLTQYMERVTREREAYERAGDVAGVAACDAESSATRAKLTN
jgi:hypothetical protein